MRLLNARTLEFQEFFEAEKRPHYAILSHTWGEEEVTFQDMLQYQYQQQTELPPEFSQMPLPRSKPAHEKAGFEKIRRCAQQALDHLIEYIWVDTCCIDKTSSAELTEAINSMFQWYQRSSICYAHLCDVFGDLEQEEEIEETLEFRQSRWFTRGWTLQELLAPKYLIFFNAMWEPIAAKNKLSTSIDSRLRNAASVLPDITGIQPSCLYQLESVYNKDFATRMSWASRRVTTRKEDEAYCLLGLFGVHMPLLYGEGDRAFIRLQEEIMKESEDLSLLAWGLLDFDLGRAEDGGLLARSPLAFSQIVDSGVPMPHKADIELQRGFRSSDFPPTMTSRGLRLSLPVVEADPAARSMYVVLRRHGPPFLHPPMLLPLEHEKDNIYWRPPYVIPQTFEQYLPGDVREGTKDIYIRKHLPPYFASSSQNSRLEVRVDFGALLSIGYRLTEWHPSRALEKQLRVGRGLDQGVVSCRAFAELVLKFNLVDQREQHLSPRASIVVLHARRATDQEADSRDRWCASLYSLENESQGMIHILAEKPWATRGLVKPREVKISRHGIFWLSAEAISPNLSDVSDFIIKHTPFPLPKTA